MMGLLVVVGGLVGGGALGGGGGELKHVIINHLSHLDLTNDERH